MKKLIALLLLPSLLMAQEKNPYGSYTPSVAAKPTTTNITAVSNAAVNLSTGAVQNKVGIYTIKENNFSWPISLDYSYSGLRTMDEPSLVGLGWGLVATGSVEREVRGIPDDFHNGYYGSQSIRTSVIEPFAAKDDSKINVADMNQRKLIKEHIAYKLAQGIADGEPDVFHIRLGNIQCSFKLGNNLTPVFLSNQNIKVEFTWDEIKITDTAGVVYILKDKHLIKATELSAPTNPTGPDGVTTYTAAWYLSKIELPTSNKTIDFAYDVKTFTNYKFLPKVSLKAGQEPEFLIESERDSIRPITNDTIKIIDVEDHALYAYMRKPAEIKLPVLSNITFSSGSLHFTSIMEDDYPLYKTITLKNKMNQAIDTYEFTQVKHMRRALTSIKKNNEKFYDFEYYYGTYPEFNHNIEDKKIKYGFDFWGYANGQPVQKEALKLDEPNYYRFPGYGSALSGALTKITHKTGGTTEIAYEPHTVKQKRHAQLHGKPVNRRVVLNSRDTNADGTPKENTYLITFNEKTTVKISHHAAVYDYNNKVKLSLKRKLSNGEVDQHDRVEKFRKEKRVFIGSNDTSILPSGVTLTHNLYGFIQKPGPLYSDWGGAIGDHVDVLLKQNPNPSTNLYELNSAIPKLEVEIENTNNHATPGHPDNENAVSHSISPYFEIEPGTYELKVYTELGGFASVAIDYNNGQTPEYYNQEYGGIRVSSITANPGTNPEDAVVKKYYYNDEDGYSTGAVITSEDNLFEVYYLRDKYFSSDPNAYSINNIPLADYFSNPNVYKMHVRDRGLPVFYTKVSETINPTIKTMAADAAMVFPIAQDDCHFGIVGNMNFDGSMIHSVIGGNELLDFYQPTEGYTTYEFEAPYQFKNYRGANLQFIYRYHEPPKGIDRAGIKLVKQSIYKGSEKFDFATPNKVSEQTQVYEKVMLPVNTLEQSTDANYPSSLRVTSNGTKFMKNVYHVDNDMTAQNSAGLKDKYLNGSIKEYLDYFKTYWHKNGVSTNSPLYYSLIAKVETNSISMVNNVSPISCLNSYGGGSSIHEATRASYVITEYKEVDVDFRQKSMSTVNYFTESTARSMSGSSDVTYDAKGQMKTSTQTDSQGNVTLTKYYYPYDISTTVNQALVAANTISQPVKTEVYLNNVLQSTSEVEFGAFVINNKTYYLPKRVKSSKENGTLESTAELVKYDASGNLLEFKQDNGLSTIFIWGYNDTKLLAKIENASYSALPPDLTNLINSVKSLSDNDTTAAAETTLRNELNKLRSHSQLANAQLSTYTYDPYIGVTSITDVRGYTTYYSYDNQHRLKYLKDEDGNVLEAYNYNFKTNQ